MCYRAGAFLGPDAAADLADLELLGWLGKDSPQAIGLVDPLEDGSAVEVRQHPAVLIARDPELHRVVREWDTGVRRKPRRGDSHWRTVALQTMRGARAREQVRDLKRTREGLT